MTERDFVYWLQGWLEIANPEAITPAQVQCIKDHMALVLTKVTPSVNYRDAQTPRAHRSTPAD